MTEVVVSCIRLSSECIMVSHSHMLANWSDELYLSAFPAAQYWLGCGFAACIAEPNDPTSRSQYLVSLSLRNKHRFNFIGSLCQTVSLFFFCSFDDLRSCYLACNHVCQQNHAS